MGRTCLLALLVLLTTRAAAEDDPRVASFKLFFKEVVQSFWTGQEQSEQRVVLVRGFDRHDVPDAARWLLTEVLLKDDSGDVQREAVRVLSGYKNPDTVREMADLWEKRLGKDPDARILALYAFGRIHQDDAERILGAALKDRDPRVVVAALRAIGMGRRQGFKEAVVANLGNKHRAMRGAAALALADLRADDMLPAVFELFCGDPSQRVRYDAWLALKELARENLPCDPDAWQGWWEKQAAEAAGQEGNPWGSSFPKLAKNAGRAGNFFGIPLLGDRIGFVLDVSMSLEDAWNVDHKAQREMDPENRIPNFFSVKTRWGLVRNYVDAVLDQMPEDVEVGFVFFNHDIFPWPENGRYMRNKAKLRPKISTHLQDEVPRTGGCAMYEAFQAAWDYVRPNDAKLNFDRGFDTLVFVTDSQVRDGAMKDRPEALAGAAWRAIMTRHLRVHAVGIHYHDYALCKTVAEASTGLYVHAQQEGDTAEPQDLDFWPAKKKAFEEARKKTRR